MDFLPHEQLQELITALIQAGYSCVGPQARDGAIVYDTFTDIQQLPWGLRDYQTPGEYRLEKIPEQEAFAFSNGPQAIKPLLFKSRETVWQVKRDDAGKLAFIPTNTDAQLVAVIGARACDIAGMLIQDKVFIKDTHVDIRYRARREKLFIVGINCTYSSNNCFCVSAGTGPNITNNYDILMTELFNGFVIVSGSEKGQKIIHQLDLKPATKSQLEQAPERVEKAAQMQTKQIPFNNSFQLRTQLFNNLEHPRWAEVADRCLSCGNCVQVCPTCFCHSEVEKPALDGHSSEHQREWDSCFSSGHSYLNKQVLRDDTRKQYRQWLTHKVGSWHDQFDTSGCVGCGRCITACPVGIDLTEELAAITGESNVKSTK